MGLFGAHLFIGFVVIAHWLFVVVVVNRCGNEMGQGLRQAPDLACAEFDSMCNTNWASGIWPVG